LTSKEGRYENVRPNNPNESKAGFATRTISGCLHLDDLLKGEVPVSQLVDYKLLMEVLGGNEAMIGTRDSWS
jgi:hypothetical protein